MLPFLGIYPSNASCGLFFNFNSFWVPLTEFRLNSDIIRKLKNLLVISLIVKNDAYRRIFGAKGCSRAEILFYEMLKYQSGQTTLKNQEWNIIFILFNLGVKWSNLDEFAKIATNGARVADLKMATQCIPYSYRLYFKSYSLKIRRVRISENEFQKGTKKSYLNLRRFFWSREKVRSFPRSWSGIL